MTCPNCGANNIDGSSFCIKCGSNLKDIQQSNANIDNTSIQNEQLMNNQPEQPMQQQTIYNQTQNNYQQSINNQSNVNVSNAPLNYFAYVIAILLKPFKSFKEEEKKLCNTKTSLIFSSIVAGAMMLITLLKAMIATVFTKSMDYSTFKYKTSVDFSRLKDLDWLSLIGKNLLIFAGVVVALALVYYIVSLIFKKSANFIKLLSISATSLIPYILLGMIVSPLIGKIWAPLSVFAMVIGAVYSLLIFINLINEDLSFDSIDLKIYFHLICLSILGSAGYYLYMKLMVSSVSTNINDILNMFG